MINTDLLNINSDVFNYIATFLDSRSVLNLMATCKTCYGGIQMSVLNDIFQRAEKSCDYEEAIRLHHLETGKNEYDRLITRRKRLYSSYKDYTKGKNYPFKENPPSKTKYRKIKIINAIRGNSHATHLVDRITKLDHQIDQLSDVYRTGEYFIMKILGPKTYEIIQNIEDLSDDDYQIGRRSFSNHKPFLERVGAGSLSKTFFKYISEKYPVVKGSLNGMRFVIIHCTRYERKKYRHITKRSLCSLVICQNQNNTWLSIPSSILFCQPIERWPDDYNEQLFKLVHNSKATLRINDRIKVQLRLGQHDSAT